MSALIKQSDKDLTLILPLKRELRFNDMIVNDGKEVLDS